MNDFEYKPTLLIIGISSFVGSNLAQYFSKKFRVIGTYHTQPLSLKEVTSVYCDISKKDLVQKICQWAKPNYVIYCAGESSLMECQSFPKVSELRNSTGIVNSLLASDRVGAKFIYISSSYVHGGDESILKESDTPLPESVYGHNVSASEFYVQRSSLNYLILRTCPLYGIGYGSRIKNIFERTLYSVTKEKKLELDSKIKTGFLDVMIFAQTLETIIDKKITNRLIQISSKDIMTYFDFSVEVAKTLNIDERFLVKSPESVFNTINSNKKNLNEFFFQMDVTNIENILSKNMPTIKESLKLTLKNLKSSEKSA